MYSQTLIKVEKDKSARATNTIYFDDEKMIKINSIELSLSVESTSSIYKFECDHIISKYDI